MLTMVTSTRSMKAAVMTIAKATHRARSGAVGLPSVAPLSVACGWSPPAAWPLDAGPRPFKVLLSFRFMRRT